jgi:hypothetical protein
MSRAEVGLAGKYGCHAVARTLLPMKTEAMDDREKREREDIAALRVELEANGMDADKVAPRPRRNLLGATYYLALGKYEFCNELTATADADPHSAGKRRIVAFDDKRIAGYIERARKDAAEEFEVFVFKLCQKTGENVTRASLSGDYADDGHGLWRSILLTVEKADGAVERWETKNILNRTKFGRPFVNGRAAN